jgi:proteasome beta subunit
MTAFPVPHGTTIVALSFADGVLVAGDRRATSGNEIAQRDLEKVVVIDETTAAGFAGAVGPALQMLRLFAVEVEQYEKVEGTPISFGGKANRLAAALRGNLGAALQGFVAMPILVGYDRHEPDPAQAGKIVTFDVTGSIAYDATGYDAIGSGSPFAKAALKKRHSRTADREAAARTAVEALYDAADDDTATGGPDVVRGIYPVVVTITGPEGAVRMGEGEMERIARDVVSGREANPGG